MPYSMPALIACKHARMHARSYSPNSHIPSHSLRARQDFAQHSPQLKMQAFEDALKRRYMDFCACLERGASDEMEYYRSKVLSHIAELLAIAPEGEQVLLPLLVNKRADTPRKVASTVCGAAIAANPLAVHASDSELSHFFTVMRLLFRYLSLPGLVSLVAAPAAASGDEGRRNQ